MYLEIVKRLLEENEDYQKNNNIYFNELMEMVYIVKGLNLNEDVEKSAMQEVVDDILTRNISHVNKLLAESNFKEANAKTKKIFNDFKFNYSTRDYVASSNILSEHEKTIFQTVLWGSLGAHDFISNRLSSLKGINKLDQNILMKNIDDIVFSEEMDKVINKKYVLNEDNAFFYMFFNYIRKEILPSYEHEAAVSFYLYALSGNLHKDLKDTEFNKIFFTGDKESIKEALLEKQKSHQIPLYLEYSDKSNNYSCKVTYKNFPFRYLNNNRETAPSGYIDYAIKDSEDDSKIYIGFVKSTTMENDIHGHAKKSVAIDTALSKWSIKNNKKIEFFDSQKGHKLSFITSRMLNRSDFSEIEKIEIKKHMDTIINRLNYHYTGVKKNIIQPGDTKYSIEDLERKNVYEDFIYITKLITNNDLKIDTKDGTIVKIFKESLEWLSQNIINDKDFVKNKNIINEIKKSLIEVNDFFDKEMLISGSIKNLLNRLKNNNLEELEKEIRLQFLAKKLLTEESYFKSLNSKDFISIADFKKIENFKNDLFNKIEPFIQEVIKFESLHRINATKMSNIYLKHKYIRTSEYNPIGINEKYDKEQGKYVETKIKYFSQYEMFTPNKSYQKSIESLLLISNDRNGIESLNNLEVVINNLMKNIDNGKLFNEIKSNKNEIDFIFENIEFKRMIFNFSKKLSEINDFYKNDIEVVINESRNKYQREVPSKIKEIEEKLVQLRNFRKESNYNEHIDQNKLDKLELEINRKSKIKQKNKMDI